MHSFGGWTCVPPLGRKQSVDSSSETDAFSLITTNPELRETSYIDIDATRNMALPLSNDQPYSGNLSPVRSAIVDWVQEQSQHDQASSDATRLQLARGDENLPCADQSKRARAKIDDNVSNQKGGRPAKKVYDLATLLSLKETQSAVPVMLRVKPEAIAGECYEVQAA